MKHFSYLEDSGKIFLSYPQEVTVVLRSFYCGCPVEKVFYKRLIVEEAANIIT